MQMLDPTTFDYRESRWQDLFAFLDGKGYDVYPPATKLGDCTKPYIVVKYAGATKLSTVSSRQDLYDIMVYVPLHKYAQLEVLVQKVINDMKEIAPLFLPYDMEQDESVLDPAVNGHYVTLTYCNYKKN